jgi:phosphopantothenoylcysteine decarboxylase/phosphopantothenate--cysteine ligase
MSKRVLIGVTGGIAAYKVCEVVSPLTFATLSRNPAYGDRPHHPMRSPPMIKP